MSKKPLLSKEEKTFRKKAKNLHDRLTKKGTLCDDWKDRKTFREWLRVNLVEFPDNETIFDTELFSDGGVFRPETVCFVPEKLYRLKSSMCFESKKKEIQSVAEKYKSFLDPKVYNLFMNYDSEYYMNLHKQKVQESAPIKIGDTFSSLNGDEYKVVEYINSTSITIESTSGERVITNLNAIKRKIVTDGDRVALKENRAKESQERTKKKLQEETEQAIGLTKKNMFGSEMTIVDYKDSKHITVKFSGIETLVNASMTVWENGNIYSPYNPSVAGVGYIGEGRFSIQFNREYYEKWNNMLNRVYNENFLKKNVAYRGTKVSEEWYNFQNFAEWCEQHFVEGWELDKDLLGYGKKIYSPETCCYLPHEINIFLRMSGKSRSKLPKGVDIKDRKRGYIRYRARTSGYINGEWKKKLQGKERKTPEEAHADYVVLRTQSAQELARMFKDRLDPMAYEALMNYNEDERSV